MEYGENKLNGRDVLFHGLQNQRPNKGCIGHWWYLSHFLPDLAQILPTDSILATVDSLFCGLWRQRPNKGLGSLFEVSQSFLARFGSNFVCRYLFGHYWQYVSWPLKSKKAMASFVRFLSKGQTKALAAFLGISAIYCPIWFKFCLYVLIRK